MSRHTGVALAWGIAGWVCLSAGVLAGCHAHRDAAPVAAPAVASASVPATAGIELREPRARLYTAGQPTAQDWAGIQALGITTVVNLRTREELGKRDEAAEVQAAGMRYVEIPVAGADAIDEANAARLHAALQAADGPVLVHCASANRVGGLLALMQARIEGVPAAQALQFGRKAGMASTELRVRELLQAPACAGGAVASGVPEGCP